MELPFTGYGEAPDITGNRFLSEQPRTGGDALGNFGKALAAAGAMYFGGPVGTAAAMTAYGQSEANRQNREIAQEQMQFQERMSNSAYQRQAMDLEAAGYNRNLAYANGGASTPSGASAQMGNVFEGLSNSALQMRAINGQLQKVESDVALNQKSAELMESQKTLADTSALKAAADTTLANSQAASVQATLARSAPRAEFERKWGNILGPVDAITERLGVIMHGASSAKGLYDKVQQQKSPEPVAPKVNTRPSTFIPGLGRKG